MTLSHSEISFILLKHGRSQDFPKGVTLHTESYRGYSLDCHLNIVGYLLTKGPTKGESRAPQEPPGYALVEVW